MLDSTFPVSALSEINNFTNVSHETFVKLEKYAALLKKWNITINLLSKSQLNGHNLWYRHFLDSAQLVPHIPKDSKSLIDLGSGSGLPGIILAILTDLKIDLVESDQRKCAFLLEVASVLELNINVINKRIEELSMCTHDIVTARALAPVEQLLTLVHNIHKKNKLCLFLKGENVVEEINDASIYWGMDFNLHTSATDPKASVLIISDLRRL